ncbi:MAG: ATP-dependent DNA helicase RecG [Lachnospiraceae bacterium]|jgi:ATP-dependent DNA helicase RecG|nr:ATP-dependent DNA helicase RecG [Lachnospiraceae bacterium]
MNLDSRLTQLKGIGEKIAVLFEKLGIETIEELLAYYPKDYETYEKPVFVRDIKEEGMVTIRGIVAAPPILRHSGKLQIVTAILQDETGSIQVNWFQMPYLKKTLTLGKTFYFRGKVRTKNGFWAMEQPKLYKEEQYIILEKQCQPKYLLTKGMTDQGMSGWIGQALEEVFLPDYLEEIREKYHLLPYEEAIKNIHFPKNKEILIKARERLVFDEFFLFILAMKKLKTSQRASYHSFPMEEKVEIERFMNCLPYSLTKAQKKVWEDVKKDLLSSFVMNRLIQGDVGSGKTVVAILALLFTSLNGYQGAFMVPTEVLAKQHLESMETLFSNIGIQMKIDLLTGSMTQKEKKQVYDNIKSGKTKIVLGTHALFQEKVVYKNLALVVTDEQHRFGVRQREALSEKGEDPHVLVMSATPIPRTLAIILYGDLHISVIDELPALRLPIKNCVVDVGFRQKAFEFIIKEVKKGRQAYIICPMVEASEAVSLENVLDYTNMLKKKLPEGIQIAYLHGKMKAQEKNKVMEAFSSNEIQVLVSTTVIEVGVNVPNASVMMVENAERFGLAQLHQLRGRVGRGNHQSYCIFLSGNKNKETIERLDILNHSNDGFYIAKEDMKKRGPGELFGFRQSGTLDFKIGDIYLDGEILKKASMVSDILLKEDPTLKNHILLQRRLDSYSRGRTKHLNL